MAVFKSAHWQDAGLCLEGGSIIAHELRCEAIARHMKLDSDVVMIPDLSVHVSGRCNRRVCGFSVYWNTNSAIVYAMTGIVYCYKIYIECGQPLAEDVHEIYTKPKIFLMRDSSRSTELRWNDNIQVRVVQTSAHLSKFMITDEGEFGVLEKYMECSETELFRKTVSSIYVCVTQNVCMVSERELSTMEKVNRLASEKKLLLFDGSRVENFFLSEVCVLQLGGESRISDVLGSVKVREHLSDLRFTGHRVCMMNAYKLAMVLNSVYENKHALPVVDAIDRDAYRGVAERYFRNFIDVNNATIDFAAKLLRNFNETFSIQSICEECPFEARSEVSKSNMTMLLSA
ncbi:tegument protein [Suid betaherpesvirus 2]|uniref:Tegument protein n=1 Tax=Suid betaherpesvirus 2 TaxID=1608255 RepID=U3GPL2_9BETA|nr:tegument protein [Suid betaherpesvirus 2]AGT99251.1 tegument protein [Suid betaherpesvirus 2]